MKCNFQASFYGVGFSSGGSSQFAHVIRQVAKKLQAKVGSCQTVRACASGPKGDAYEPHMGGFYKTYAVCHFWGTPIERGMKMLHVGWQVIPDMDQHFEIAYGTSVYPGGKGEKVRETGMFHKGGLFLKHSLGRLACWQGVGYSDSFGSSVYEAVMLDLKNARSLTQALGFWQRTLLQLRFDLNFIELCPRVCVCAVFHVCIL